MTKPNRKSRLSLVLVSAFTALALVRCAGESNSLDPSPDVIGTSKAPLTLESGDFIKDIQELAETASASINSNPQNFTLVGTTVFFTATESSSGTELWKSDGSSAGTTLVADIRTGTASSSPKDLIEFDGKLYFTADDGVIGRELWVSDGTGPGTHPVLDLNPGSAASNPTGLIVYDDALYFAATTAANGIELWRTDGTAIGTQLVADINPGPANSSPAGFAIMGGALFFAADDGNFGKELWRTDGTAAGTWLVKDINPNGASNPAHLTAVGDKLFFAANDGTHGTELWVSDGTQGNALLLGDLRPGTSASSPTELFAYGNILLFSADDGSGVGRELWKSDGTPEGTVMLKDLKTNGSSNPKSFIEFKGLVYFNAGDTSAGTELFRTDGTPEGTDIFIDLNPGNTNTDPKYFAVMGDYLYFSDGIGAATGYDGEMWRTDGTVDGTELVKDIRPGGSHGGDPQYTFAVGNTLFFSADDGAPTSGGHGRELWITDGTEAGTRLLKDINANSTQGSNPINLAAFGDKLIFAATDSVHTSSASYKEPWISDGTEAGTTIIKDIATRTVGSSIVYGSGPSPYVMFKGRAYFTADDEATSSHPGGGREVWSTDGTEAGTEMLIDLKPGYNDGVAADPEFTVLGDYLYFIGDFPGAGKEVLRTDGTEAGTEPVLDIYPGTTTSNPSQLTVMDGILYFVARGSAAEGPELWRSDGTPGGTRMVKDIRPGGVTSSIANITVVGNRLVFTATDGTDDGAHGTELWSSDGTEAGTVLVKDITPGTASTTFVANSFTVVDNRVFFLANDGSGVKLWVTDGTEAGTAVVKEIQAGAVAANYSQLSAAGDKLYFVGDDGVHGPELWISDGTEAGTRLVKDIRVGSTGSDIGQLTVLGDRVYFVANDGPHGSELWSSDGTFAGTQLVKDIMPGSRGSNPVALTVIDGKLVFGADDGVSGQEPWVSDGTEEGTRQVVDLNPGPFPSSPSQFVRAGNKVYVVATHSLFGTELAVLGLNDNPPVITCPADISVPTAVASGAVVDFAATATDDGETEPVITYSVDPGTLFPSGNTVVVATATDDGGNTATCSFNVAVLFTDVIAPTITCPADVVTTVSSPTGGPVEFEPATATDDNTAEPTITYSQPSGSVFPVGETTVTATARDDSGNAAVCTFLVTVELVENESPVVLCPPDVTATSEFPDGIEVTYPDAIASDDDTAEPTVSYSVNSGERFPVGETVVTVTATDEAGNTGNCTFKVTVTHEPPPPVDEGCGCGSAGGEPGSIALAMLLGLGLMARRVRRTA